MGELTEKDKEFIRLAKVYGIEPNFISSIRYQWALEQGYSSQLAIVYVKQREKGDNASIHSND